MNIGYFEQEFNSYLEALNYLRELETSIKQFGYALWAGNPERGWLHIIDPVIRQRASKWVLKMDAPQDFTEYMEMEARK